MMSVRPVLRRGTKRDTTMRNMLLLPLLLSCLLCGQWAAAQKYEGAHLSVENSFHNFGDVPRRGGDLVWEFAIANDGSEPLLLQHARTTCTCLKATFPRRPIAPGERAAIRVVYEPHKNEPGTFSKVIQIYSNSEGGRELLTVCGNSVEGNSVEVRQKERHAD